MRRRLPPQRLARTGFTVIELLVVITIIAVMVALIGAAVVRVKDVGPRTVCRSDISKLEASIAAFCTDFGVDYIPSRLILREDGAWGTNPTPALAALEVQSLAYLKKLWPRMAIAGSGFAGHDWNSDGAVTAGANGVFILEGDQCLVFFLGGARVGLPPTSSLIGFSANREYPMRPGESRKGPFYDFQSSRLNVINPSATRSQYFVSYLDGYEKAPYAYFSSRSFGSYAVSPTPGRRYEATDCQGLGVQFYYDTNNRAYNPDGYQILCAGRDATFGPGGLYNQASGNQTPPTNDDMANFHRGLLGGGTVN